MGCSRLAVPPCSLATARTLPSRFAVGKGRNFEWYVDHLSTPPFSRPIDHGPDIEPINEMRPISQLAHGLDRALFKYVDGVIHSKSSSDQLNSPGVNWLQDPRSRIFNYDPWLQKIPSVRDFAFERLPGFVKSSRDEVRLRLHISLNKVTESACRIYGISADGKVVNLPARHLHLADSYVISTFFSAETGVSIYQL